MTAQDDGVTLPVIGVIRTPFTRVEDLSRQARLALDVTGRAELKPAYAQGLDGVAGCGKVWLFYCFHGIGEGEVELVTRSRNDGRIKGVFATRSPRRPSRMGASLVDVVRVDGAVIEFAGVDMLDGSPLLDVKPYIGEEG